MNEDKVKQALDACRDSAKVALQPTSDYMLGHVTVDLTAWTKLVLAIDPIGDDR